MWRCQMRSAVSPQSGAPAPFCMQQHARTLQVWFTAALPAFTTELFLLHLPASYLFDRQDHLPRLSRHSCMHCEACHVVQAREVHSLEDLQGHCCPSAILTSSRTGPPSQVQVLIQSLAPVLHICQGKGMYVRTTVHTTSTTKSGPYQSYLTPW